MFDEADRETGFVLALVIALAIVVSLAAIGIAAGTAIGNLGRMPGAAPAQRAPATALRPGDEKRVHFHIERGSSEPPADAPTRVAPLVKAAAGESDPSAVRHVEETLN